MAAKNTTETHQACVEYVKPTLIELILQMQLCSFDAQWRLDQETWEME